MSSLAAFESMPGSFLKISCNGQADAIKLKSLLKPYCKSASDELRGCAVKIEYHNKTSKVELMLGNDWRVNLHEELIAGLTEWLSQSNVKILYN
jgi:DNA polymerase III subunit alpha